MAKLKMTGKDLIAWGMEPGRVMGTALTILRKEYKHSDIEEVRVIVENLLEAPENYVDDEVLGDIALELIPPEEPEGPKMIDLNDEPVEISIYGSKGIERGAIDQINLASMLPIAVKGALMPDAHQGYGLPIGGVLATDNAVIPYGVGVDIGCRMCMTIYDEKANYINGNRKKLTKILKEDSFFGMGVENDGIIKEHPFLDRPEFNEIPNIKKLKDKAWRQLGTSGGGNHFVDIGIVKITDPDNDFGLEVGEYVGLLTHSGSRGFGATLADTYTKIAMEKTPLPKEAKHLAWLDLDSEEGIEYWVAMKMAGDYAQACHDEIHRRVAKNLKLKPVAKIENHHNFAWKEQLDGREVIVHRKGATPAGKGVLGIIPGSMISDAFIVRGRGVVDAISSASHGAGRTMSRKKARDTFTKSGINKLLKKHTVSLVGGGTDEGPLAYKDISKVMAAQGTLIDVLGTFTPQVVRMADDNKNRKY